MYTIDKSISQQINAMKFFFVFLVVFIHSEALPQLPYELVIPNYMKNCKQIISVFTDVAIPGFAFFSGFFLFSREFTWRENMRKKVRSILIPYFIINSFWIAFFILVQKVPMLAGYFTAPEYKIDSLDDIIIAYLGQVPLYYPFWFLKDLFTLNVFASVFQKILNKIPWIIMIGLLFLQFSNISVPLIYNKQVLIWFLFGGIWVRYGLDLSIIKKIPSLLLAFMTFMVILVKIIWTENVLVAAFSLVIIFCFFYILADKLMHSRMRKAVIWGGQFGFFVYASHEYYEAMFKKIVMMIFPQYGIIQMLEYFLLPVGVWGGCILIGVCCKKYALPIYKLVCGSR